MPELATAIREVRRRAVGAVCLASAALLYAPAAANAEKSGYESVSVPGGPGTPADPTLPFSGFDLAAAAAVGLAMLMIGIGLWQLGGRGAAPESEDAS